MINSIGIGWMSMPVVLCAETLLSSMFSNTSSSEAKRAELIEWLSDVPDELLSAEELQRREDDRLLALFGMQRPS